jgi:hypothetical protein
MDTPSHNPKKIKVAVPTKVLIQSGIAIVLVIVSFYGGVAYQKSKKTTVSDMGNTQLGMNGQGFGNGGGQFGSGGGRQMMTLSEVTAVSGTSISVKLGDGTAKTYTINDSTSIVKDGASATTSDIATGDTVSVSVSSTDASVARRIIVNPQMGMNGPQTDTQTN